MIRESSKAATCLGKLDFSSRIILCQQINPIIVVWSLVTVCMLIFSRQMARLFPFSTTLDAMCILLVNMLDSWWILHLSSLSHTHALSSSHLLLSLVDGLKLQQPAAGGPIYSVDCGLNARKISQPRWPFQLTFGAGKNIWLLPL